MKSQQCQHLLYFQSSHSAQRSKSLQLTSSWGSQLMHDKQMQPDVPCFFSFCVWISSLSHILPVFLFFKEQASLSASQRVWRRSSILLKSNPLENDKRECFYFKSIISEISRYTAMHKCININSAGSVEFTIQYFWNAWELSHLHRVHTNVYIV